MTCMRVHCIFTKLDVVYLRVTLFYIYIYTYHSFKWKWTYLYIYTYIQKRIIVIISLPDGVFFFSCEVSFASITVGMGVSPYNKYAHVCEVPIHNNECGAYNIGVSFGVLLVIAKCNLVGECPYFCQFVCIIFDLGYQ